MTGSRPVILALTRYGRMGASSRVRIMQFAPYLEDAGLHLEVSPLLDDAYLASHYAGKASRGVLLRCYSRRLRALRKSKPAAFWLEKEALPWVPNWVEFLLRHSNIPVISDYDDAVFHTYDEHRFAVVRHMLGAKIDGVMASSDVVFAGNAYLASRAEAAGARDVRIVPTVIDVSKYGHADRSNSGPVTVGWIGSPSTWKEHLCPRLAVLETALRQSGAQLLIVGAGERGRASDVTRFLDWSEASEVPSIQQMDIGIMPLPDDAWSRGKCGYKLIQYMACGLPVVASPVGVNKNIVEHGRSGFLADGDSDWHDALVRLIQNTPLRTTMGQAGRAKIEDAFSTRVWGPQIAGAFRSLIEGRSWNGGSRDRMCPSPERGMEKCAD